MVRPPEQVCSAQEEKCTPVSLKPWFLRSLLPAFKCSLKFTQSTTSKAFWPFPTHLPFLIAQLVKNLPAVQETRVWSLGQEDLLEKEMATHSSILVWKILWIEEPGGLQSMGSQELDQLSNSPPPHISAKLATILTMSLHALVCLLQVCDVHVPPASLAQGSHVSWAWHHFLPTHACAFGCLSLFSFIGINYGMKLTQNDSFESFISLQNELLCWNICM